MLKFLARRRFNYIDILTLSVAAGAFREGDVAIGLLVLLAGFTASILAERGE